MVVLLGLSRGGLPAALIMTSDGPRPDRQRGREISPPGRTPRLPQPKTRVNRRNSRPAGDHQFNSITASRGVPPARLSRSERGHMARRPLLLASALAVGL